MLMWSLEVVFTHCSHHTVTLIFVRSIAKEKLMNKMFRVFLSEGQTALLQGCDVALEP